MNSTKELGDLNENVDNASITLEPVNGEDEKKKKASGCRCWLVKKGFTNYPLTFQIINMYY